jgi:hypothetical protein
MNETQIDTQLVFATYVTATKDGETEVVYLQETQKTENLNSISYNIVSKE